MSISRQRKPDPLPVIDSCTKVPGCAICDKAFDAINKPSESSLADIKIRNISLQANQILATQCGHLYHLRCLEGALVHEKLKLADKGLPNRRSCPNSECLKDLTTTKLIKVHLKGVSSDSSGNDIIAENRRLQAENTRLRNQLQTLQDKDMTRVGEKVFVQNTNGTYTRATVTELMVKVHKDSDPSPSNSSKQESTSRTGSFKGKFSPFVKDQIVPMNRIILSRHFGRLATNDDMKAKWNAGDRIFVRSEEKRATIKWIGSRNQTFMALLEYDDQISTEILSDAELPCSPKPYHCKMVYLNELNLMAEKVQEPETSKSPVLRFFRNTSLRRSAHQ